VSSLHAGEKHSQLQLSILQENGVIRVNNSVGKVCKSVERVYKALK